MVTIRDELDRPAELATDLVPRLELVMKSRGAWTASSSAHSAPSGARFLDYEELSGLRLGLVTSLARPDRISAWLGRRGVTPEVILSGGDHRPVSTRAMREAGKGLDAWLATEKCATHLGAFADLPVFTLDYRAFPAVALVAALGAALTAQTSGHRLENSEFLPCALGTEPRPWGP